MQLNGQSEYRPVLLLVDLQQQADRTSVAALYTVLSGYLVQQNTAAEPDAWS